jgi:hypothetical protein
MSEPAWLDILARKPAFRNDVNLTVLDDTVHEVADTVPGGGELHTGPSHEKRLTEFLSAVARYAPRLCWKPPGPVEGPPPRRKKEYGSEGGR